MKYFFIIVSLIICDISLQAQLFQDAGAISTSMAGLNTNNNNVWSVNNNIGQLSKLENATISISSFQPFLIKDFTTSNIVLGMPVGNGAFGFNYSNSGNKYLQMHNLGIGYSKKLGSNFHSGIKINYSIINAGDFYNKRAIWNADLGMSASLSKELELGVTIKNVTLSKIANYNNERLTTSFQIGASYHFSKDLIVQTGLEKNINYPASFLAAINYKPNEKIIINGGIASNPSLAAFGISLIQNKFILSFATQLHQYLGWSPDISIIYQFK